MKTKSKTAKEKRGFTTEIEDSLFTNRSDSELIFLLRSNNSKERTSSAKTLGQRRSQKAIVALCEQLKNEKALYSKIAISEALGNIGKPAVKELIKYLGAIGSNQHKALPKKKFNKKSYPLSRDIIARTICKIGNGALVDLNNILENGTKKQTSEAIDAVGSISFYCEDKSSFKSLERSLQEYKRDEIIQWKIIRALSAFPNKKSEMILLDILKTSKKPELKWEADRSLKLIQK
ncbi:MAG: HEAT repeat domain-containing protein [Candidatus Pacebacteria bacterium]|nr:HEAT repeat domain-containing protein [Candidatus Paceibacterota bacterium]